MPDAVRVPSNPTMELDVLKYVLEQLTAGVISRPLTVRAFDTDTFWPGPWPVIRLRPYRFRVYRLSGGRTGTKGQDGRKPNLYSIEIHDVIRVRDITPDSALVEASQRDCLLLIQAIVEYFDHAVNRDLIDANGNQCATLAGEEIDFQGGPPFTDEGGGDQQVFFAGTISLVGNPHIVSET